jgi:hypothetical protein
LFSVPVGKKGELEEKKRMARRVVEKVAVFPASMPLSWRLGLPQKSDPDIKSRIVI